MSIVKFGEISDESLVKAMHGAMETGDVAFEFHLSERNGKLVMEVHGDVPGTWKWLMEVKAQ